MPPPRLVHAAACVVAVTASVDDFGFTSYDCSTEGDEATWSDGKRQWCCQLTGRGCPARASASAEPCPQVGLPEVNFDCSAGFRNWRAGWSPEKQHYCCAREGKGCTATDCQGSDCGEGEGYECDLGNEQWETAWSPEKQRYCCEHGGVSCGGGRSFTQDINHKVYVVLPGASGGGGAQPCPTAPVPPVAPVAPCAAAPCATAPCPTAQPCPTVPPRPVEPTPRPVEPPFWEATATSTTTSSSTSSSTATTSTTSSSTSSTLPAIWRPVDPPPPPPPPPPTCPAAMTCNLNCYTPTSATPFKLPGAEGAGTDVGVPDLTLDECRQRCRDANGCEAIVHVGYGKGTCYGKQAVRTSAAEGGCQVQPPFVTEFVCGAPWGKCSILGDPHITPFDRKMLGSYPINKDDWYMAPVNFYNHGEYYLVKSPDLQIRGRFGYTQSFPSASSALGAAATGPLLGGHTLAVAYVGPEPQQPAYRGWKVTWDGKVILETFPSHFASEDGLLKASFADMEPRDYAVRARSTIGTDTGLHPSFLFDLGKEAAAQIYVLPGSDMGNIVITMRKLPDQDGLCGNFNCNWDDDSKEDLQDRGFWQDLGEGASLFPALLRSPDGWDRRSGPSPEEIMASCPPSVEQQANCKGSAPEQEACLFDACMAAAGHVLQRSQLPAALRPFGSALHVGSRTMERLAFSGSLLGCIAVSYMWWSGQVARRQAGRGGLPAPVEHSQGAYRLVASSPEVALLVEEGL